MDVMSTNGLEGVRRYLFLMAVPAQAQTVWFKCCRYSTTSPTNASRTRAMCTDASFICFSTHGSAVRTSDSATSGRITAGIPRGPCSMSKRVASFGPDCAHGMVDGAYLIQRSKQTRRSTCPSRRFFHLPSSSTSFLRAASALAPPLLFHQPPPLSPLRCDATSSLKFSSASPLPLASFQLPH